MQHLSSEMISKLSKAPLFSKLNNTDINHLLTKSTLESFPAHVTITVEGEPGDTMYLICSGEVSVSVMTDDGQKLKLAVLKAGQYFGEQVLIPEASRLRSATTKTLTEAELLCIPRDVFLSTIGMNQEVLGDLKEMGFKHLRQRLAQESALFRSIPLTPDAKDWLVEKKYSPGDIVFKQGDAADDFYLVLWGVAEVVVKSVEGEKIRHVSSGGFFGELALINDSPRTATVRAKSELLTLVLRGESFKSLYRRDRNLQKHFDNLNTIYRLPDKGMITMHTSKLMEHEASTAIYHNREGAQVTFTRAVRKPIFSFSKTGSHSVSATQYRFEDRENEVFREITVADGRIVSANCVGQWLDMGYLLHSMYVGRTMLRRQLALFRQEGDLRINRNEFDLGGEAIVCQCASISRGEIRKCINSGFGSVEDISDETGAGKVCGSCIPIITDMLGHTEMRLVELAYVKVLSEDIKSFGLKPKKGELVSAQPTQHINVEGQIGGQWVQRSYTLTSPSQNTDVYEITVKKEEEGLFSSWLHDELTSEDVIRVSLPKGGYAFPSKVAVPYVFFVAGVGITPALSFLRTTKTQSDEFARKVLVDVSTKSRETSVCVDELRSIADANDNLSVNFRFTNEEGHIREEYIENIVLEYPGACFFICGPNRYQENIQAALSHAGVKSSAVHVEAFSEHAEENFDEKKRQVETLMSEPARRTTLAFCFLTLLLVLWVIVSPPVELLETVMKKLTPEFLITDKIMQQVTGYIMLGIIALGMLVSLRKRVRAVTFAKFAWWRLIHIITGALALIGLYFHTGLSLGHNQNQYLTIMLLSLALLGSVSLLAKSRPLNSVNENIRFWHIVIALFFPAFVLGHIVAGYYF